jgi:hypothetical protein
LRTEQPHSKNCGVFYWLNYALASQASFVRAYNTQHHINQTFGIHFDYHKTHKKTGRQH